MSEETKQDVFNEVMDEWQVDETMPDANWKYPDFKLVRIKEKRFKDRYDAALPDDIPVVSKDVSNTMRTYHFLWWKEFLDKAYDNELSGDEDINYKVRSESAEVARALILGVWRVAETGEIVKLEAEK
ncbi:hypothetical protein [Schleiferilactobacillus harbinensis]|uniref:Phage protein n=1 Tax=Schleiferilactobacillus harbinensis TaxID=304207 RepID=A0A5P8M3R5_9LACO|nr:hypothetical protein [Schleiferilactobacillus harbinensis]QFR23093.1 hypothetical protein D1010_06555 [Schleiferilactobacillus harbinensis]